MSEFLISQEKLNELGETLKEIRKKRNYTMYQVEAYTGLNRSEIFALENAKKKKPNPFYLKKLAEFYKISVLELYKIVGYVEDKELLKLNLSVENIENDETEEITSLLSVLNTEEQKIILNDLLEKIEYLKMKQNKYEEVKDLIELAKEKINNLK